MKQHWIEENREAIAALPVVAGENPACFVTDCLRTPHTHGLCKAHYKRAVRAFGPAAIRKDNK